MARWTALLLSSLIAGESLAAETATTAHDATLAALIEETLGASPELAASKALVRAEEERAAQAGTLPDPTLSLGIQNDGFEHIEIGNMETSFFSIAASQTFPWPGKLGLSVDIAKLAARERTTELDRARLSTIARVRSAYLELLLVRERRLLLDQLAILWTQSEQVARARYEAGEGAQADLLRAQLERARLEQRRARLRAEEATWSQALNRMRGRSLAEVIETGRPLSARARPERLSANEELEHSTALSPELAAARLSIDKSARETELAGRGLLPDLTLSTGIMARGSLPPMWQASIAVSVPIFSVSKQSAEVRENESLQVVSRESERSIARTLEERAHERWIALGLALEVLALYEGGLLIQSRATAESTLAQYSVGKVGFASVLEALAGHLNDREAHLETIAEAERIAIARDEVSLAPLSSGNSSVVPLNVRPKTAPSEAAPSKAGMGM